MVCYLIIQKLILDDEMAEPGGGKYFILLDPFLVVVEAKQTATIGLSSSLAVLLGQMRVLMAKGFVTVSSCSLTK